MVHRNDEDSIRRLLVARKQKHPRPGSEDETSRGPPALQLSTGQREGLENTQLASEAAPDVCRQVERGRSLVYVPPRLRGYDDLRHSGSQLVERRSFAAGCLG